MTEEQIELWVERATDKLDARYVGSAMTREAYETHLRGIDIQAEIMRRDRKFAS